MTGIEVRAAALEAAARVSTQGGDAWRVVDRAKVFENYLLTGK